MRVEIQAASFTKKDRKEGVYLLVNYTKQLLLFRFAEIFIESLKLV